MDNVTLRNLLTEVDKACEWLRGEPVEPGESMSVDFFGVGVVAERRQLSREQVNELLAAMQERLNQAIADREAEEFWSDVFARTYICDN